MENMQDDLRQAKKLAKEAMQRRERRFMKKYGKAADDELLAYLRQCAEELGFTPNFGDVLGAQFIQKRLGAWPRVLARAGLEPAPHNERRDGPGLFEREVQRQLGYHRKAVQQLVEQEQNFGRLHAADSDEELLAYLCEWAQRLKHSPNLCEVVGGEYIKERFGSWGHALELAGLPKPPSNPPKRWHRLVYLDALKNQHELGMDIRRRAEKNRTKKV